MNTTHYAGLFESTWKRKETILTILTSTTALLILLTSGWLRVWAGGVPHTMQTQAVIVLAMCLPRKTSLATIIAYVAVASFAPIKITMTPGIFGITGGYFFGFVLATMYLGNKKPTTLIFESSMLFWHSPSFWGLAFSGSVYGQGLLKQYQSD